MHSQIIPLATADQKYIVCVRNVGKAHKSFSREAFITTELVEEKKWFPTLDEMETFYIRLLLVSAYLSEKLPKPYPTRLLSASNKVAAISRRGKGTLFLHGPILDKKTAHFFIKNKLTGSKSHLDTRIPENVGICVYRSSSGSGRIDVASRNSKPIELYDTDSIYWESNGGYSLYYANMDRYAVKFLLIDQ